MIHIIFMYVHLMYIALTESLFLQILTLIIFKAASWIYYNPRENWYYSGDKDA